MFIKIKNSLTSERNLFPVIAYTLIFFSMMSQAPLSVYGFVQVILLMFIAHKIYEIINLYGFDITSFGKIALFSGLALIGISQFFQHLFSFSFLDWLVTFTKFNEQAPMSIFGICAYVALPLGFGIALNYRLNKKVK
ncbi:hypothetical protein AO073_01600 [Pseudomonas syringae ICMP 11293]|uniref:hypothetical protein n=1 Tax=Pseudomonas syringae TaxID=317 RepID=UPI000731593C|nr:hypothetical protein [Pseudomonas syringae]KTB91595.1 hypothetical protein AO073_01600 [Pseudomonas syringae ICMP 11293]